MDQQQSKPYLFGELFECIICDYQTNRKSNLTKHFMTHTNQKPYKCKDCEFSAAAKSTLMLHVRIHTGERPYECATCERKFSRRNILKAHIRTHTNDKPFKCSKCEFSAARKDNLKYHMRRHLKNKPFRCHICPSSFVQKCRFVHHLDVHNSDFRCYMCHYKTHLEINLIKHKLGHLNLGSFFCFWCGKEFGSKYGVKSHISKLHFNNETLRNRNGTYNLNILNKNDCMGMNGNEELPRLSKTFSDKAIETDDLKEFFAQFGNTTNINEEPCDLQDISVQDWQSSNNLSNLHLHGYVCSSDNCDINCGNDIDHHLNEILESNLIQLEVHPDLTSTDPQILNSQDVPNFDNIFFDNMEYAKVNDDSSPESSSSDSEVDSVNVPYNTNPQENLMGQSPLQTVTLVNPDVFMNYQPNVNYIMGLNLMQPVVIPTISLPQSSPLVLTSGFNNIQVNQDFNFVPISNNTNLFINNIVPNVTDTTNITINLNPTFC